MGQNRFPEKQSTIDGRRGVYTEYVDAIYRSIIVSTFYRWDYPTYQPHLSPECTIKDKGEERKGCQSLLSVVSINNLGIQDEFGADLFNL